MKRLLFVFNPNAGKGIIKQHLDRLMMIFKDAGFETTAYRTKAPLDGMRFVAEHGEEYDRIVCFGGDGTLNEIVTGVMKLKKRPTIGFIPAGSTNDTAKNFHLPTDVEQAAIIAVSGRPFKIDIGSLGDYYFVYVASFGDLPAVSALTPQEEKRRFGHAAYVIEGMKVLPKMATPHVKITYDDGESLEGEFYLGMIANSYQVGGFYGITGQSVDLQDGKFEVMLLAKPRNILDLEKQVEHVLIRKDDESVDVTYGRIPEGEDGYEVVTKFKAEKISFYSEEELQWVVDGENAGRHNEISLNNHRQAVEIMVSDQ